MLRAVNFAVDLLQKGVPLVTLFESNGTMPLYQCDSPF